MVKGLIDRYRDWLDLPQSLTPVTIGEGDTPLVHWDNWGNSRIWLKLEGTNPTGSFKDRGMTVAVSVARHNGSRAVICASTGNTAASSAAFAARAGLASVVVIPEGQVALPKMVQSAVHGAHLIAVRGNFDQALAAVRYAAQQESWLTLVNSVNPWRIRGQETSAYEIVDDLGAPPVLLALPVGNAGNISAYHKGFMRYAKKAPRFIGVQAQGADPLVQGRWLDQVKTVASAIRIGRPASADTAKAAVTETQGRFLSISDQEILAAQKDLAHGGIFVEPASAAAYGGLKKLADEEELPPGDIVVILTGMGLKDTETPQQWANLTMTPTTADSIVTTITQLLNLAEA
ncbi:MAG: threonine synthase [Sulfobacillus benefaciens]|uniref:Threonine synthase n=1 Tax=Sulfobacillus benefaciens TaxID=453960 RepID=A0A2T2XG70_9FIRM|nr:MAG: threonine synthase [Sulfobacillus benefaciens]